jgi:hypothetical protein
VSYPKKTLKIRPRRGIATDLPDWSAAPDVLSQGDNVLFRDGIATRAPSTSVVYDPLSTAPLIARNVQIGTTNYWLYSGATSSFVVTGSTHTDLTHASTQQSQTDVSRLSLELLNQVPVFNNALDEPMYWDGDVGNNYVDLPGWTSGETCRFIVPHRFHLFAFGITRAAGFFPNEIYWSDAAAPGNVPSAWTPAATNEAGSTTLSDTPGELVSARNLRASLAIYKSGSTHLADYVGGDEIFAFRTLFSQAGALTRHAVADINGAHLVVTDGDIVIHDGQTIQSVANKRRKNYLFNALDQDNFANLFTVYYREKNEVWICFPETGSSDGYATRAMVYDVANNSWGDRELTGIAFGATGIINDTAPDETWDADSEVWDDDVTVWNTVLYSLAAEALVLADNANSDFLEVDAGATSLTATVAKNDIDFGEPERFKFVRRVHLRVEADTDVDFTVRVGGKESTGGSVDYTAPATMNSDDQFIDAMVLGRLISVEVSATTTKPWRITGIDLEAEMRGYH